MNVSRDTTVNLDSSLSRRARRESPSEITALMRQALQNPRIISLAAGFVDQVTLPREETARIVQEILADPKAGQAALQYGSTIGHDGLRDVLAKRMTERGIPDISASDVVITTGSQQFLSLAADILLDPGDIVLVEDPTYFVFAGVLRNAGANAIGLPTDEHGLLPEPLEKKLWEISKAGNLDRVKFVYVMTYFSNPRGSSFAWDRSVETFELVRRYSTPEHPIFILEDTAYRELYFGDEGAPYLKTLDAGNEYVMLTGTFSKSFSPGLRAGFSAVPPALMRHILSQKSSQDFGSPAFIHAILERAMRNGMYDAHCVLLRDRYRHKRDLALRAIREHWPAEVHVDTPEGGIYIWARLPEHIDKSRAEALFRLASEKYETLYVPGSLCYVEPDPEKRPHNEIRLCYGTIDDNDLVEGVKRLGQAIAEILQ